MATESNVAISADSSAAGAHNVRTVTVYPSGASPVSVTHGEEQQVVTLAGSDGALIEATNGQLPVHSPEIVLLLKALILRLDMLNAMMDRGYRPPDELYR